MSVLKNVIWRYAHSTVSIFDICQPIQLVDGLLYVNGIDRPIDLSTGGWTYQSTCFNGDPVLSATNFNLLRLGINRLPMDTYSWVQYLNEESTGSIGNDYRFSIFSIIYSLCTATVITCSMTMVMFTKRYLATQRPSLLLQLSSAMSSILLIAIYTYILSTLSEHNKMGIVNSDSIVTELGSEVGFNVVYLFCYLLLQLCQVQLVMRLYSRNKEKRVIFFAGVFFSVLCQVIWACSIFLNDGNISMTSNDDFDDDGLAILPAFIYLLRISLAVIYSCLVSAYCFVKRSYAFKSEVKMLTVAMFIAINLSIAFFIADIADVWVTETADVFDITCYVVSNIVSWEWINRIAQFEKFRQKDGVLGRQFYEDERLMNDRFDGEEGKYLISQQSNLGDIRTNDDNKMKYSRQQQSLKKEKQKEKEKQLGLQQGQVSHLKSYSDTFFDYVDRFIAAGLVIPKGDKGRFSTIKRLFRKINFQSNDSRGNPIGFSDYNDNDLPNEVYIYSPREVDMEDVTEDIPLQRPSSSHYPNLESGDFYNDNRNINRITTSLTGSTAMVTTTTRRSEMSGNLSKKKDTKGKHIMNNLLSRKKPVIIHDNSVITSSNRLSTADTLENRASSSANVHSTTGESSNHVTNLMMTGNIIEQEDEDGRSEEYSMTEERLLSDMLISANNNDFGIEGTFDYDNETVNND